MGTILDIYHSRRILTSVVNIVKGIFTKGGMHGINIDNDFCFRD
ncbi:MAG: hypothetical protein JETT_2348 [Candidatus Jettenia ecosi]|uniref:Uncharacterized protein n=1 Tax=Candidatus Jettenia ecosi TaxID=2494326 RepID=A0A533QFI0_9BACT|nr:MAG: hypothetical protein JETT_2348 [Candidatus Jettenia ecosi]